MRPYRTPSMDQTANLPDLELLRRWADSFGVDVDEVAQAVQAVGTDPSDLQEELTGVPSLRH